MNDVAHLVRRNITDLMPYSSARHEFTGNASVFLDANENSFGSPSADGFNRYPDPLQMELKEALSTIKGVPPQNIFIGNGSDEVIDIAYRIFCEPGIDNVIICPPTYGMYEVSAHINNVAVQKVDLLPTFQMDVDGIMSVTNDNTKLLFICSPNNPTGNNMLRQDILWLLNNFPGIIILDEAYINYSRNKTCIQELTEYPNLVVMQTLSKAWGMAGLRLGLCFASEYITTLYNKVKPPYNINTSSQKLAIEALKKGDQVNDWIKQIVEERTKLMASLRTYSFVVTTYESDANFILVKVKDAVSLYQHLLDNKIIVRNRSKDPGCSNCLRLTIGTSEENILLTNALKIYDNK